MAKSTKISGRSGAAASYDKEGNEFIWPHEDPKRIDAKRALKKPHPTCQTPETCLAQNRCRKTGKALVNGKIQK